MQVRNLNAFLVAGAFLALVGTAGAQTAEPRVINGTITSVHGHLVTIQRSSGSIVVDDQQALDAKMTGNVAVGRQVVAVGHWNNGTFYATSFADSDVYGYADSAERTGYLAGRLPGAVRGTITSVSGHLVTLRSGRNSIRVNDQPALNRKLTGRVTVGRNIVASGYWRGETFYATTFADPNATDETMANFGAFARVPDSLSGTITAVNKNQVTLQQATRTIVLNDQPALNAQSTGPVGVGRAVVADGYWLHGVFYATTFTDATP